MTQTCVCPSVRPSVRVSQQKSSVTFDALDRSAQNFQGPLNSLQVIFGRVIWTLGPLGRGRTQKKGVSEKSISSGGFGAGGVVLHLFGSGTTRQTKCWERNFCFLPIAGENGARRQGWPGGNKILEFRYFL